MLIFLLFIIRKSISNQIKMQINKLQKKFFICKILLTLKITPAYTYSTVNTNVKDII